MIITEKLNGKNYLSWAASVETWFLGQGYHDHLEQENIEGSIETRDKWKELDFQLCFMLRQSVEPNILETLKAFKTCFSFWKNAQSNYTNDIQRVYDAVQKIASFKQVGHDMVSHVAQAQAALEELRMFLNADSVEGMKEKLDRFYMVLILRTLHSDFNHIRDQVLAGHEFSSMNSLITRLLRDSTGKRCEDYVEAGEAWTMVSRRRSGHETRGRGNKNVPYQCTYCKRIGHLRENCYSLHGFLTKTANLSKLKTPDVNTLNENDYQEYFEWKTACQSESSSNAIEGISIKSVNSASEKIRAVIDETDTSRNIDYSHFISLPLAIHPELVNKLINFQNSILGNGSCMEKSTDIDSNEDEDTSDNKEVDQLSKDKADIAVDDNSESVKVNRANIPIVSYTPKVSKSSASRDLGIDKSIFIKPKTFHLTVLMLKLWNKDRVKKATEVLQSLSSKVSEALDNRPVSIRLKGLECMKGSLAKARVVYAPVEEIGIEGRLMRACQVIIDAYVEAGLVLEKDAKRGLKLHATVMKSRHTKREKWTREFDPFDARGIFKQYGSEDWGQYLIREAHLSQRFSFDENGYYHCCASIPFPVNMREE
ncbi:hypothetical protein Fmac_019929 [Flemingia macrophylla]|uniref:A-kinase anchor protein 7-like phosphoesterase domain-containing protein n=1 Tax=Flemingia macrophylla TaxID=520843 RepID=A0ABD1M988_9FABA